MKIALVAPFEEPVPPATYGGTELVVFNLAEELILAGHDVTVLTTGDSRTTATVDAVYPISLRQSPEFGVQGMRDINDFCSVERVIRHLSREHYDIIHNHHTWRLAVFASYLNAPLLTTCHGRMDLPCYGHLAEHYPNAKFTSISYSQRSPMPRLNYVANVYNGIDLTTFEFKDKPGDYLVFLGRFSPEKGPVESINVARRTGRRLVMAGKVDVTDIDYFESQVQPLIDGDQIQFIGEVNHAQKNQLLGGASVLLMPINWDEPFGLVMIEAMATGTPVIAMRRGSVPEVVGEGGGIIVDSVDEMVERLPEAEQMSRHTCHAYVSEHFSRCCMMRGYADAYEKVLGVAPGVLSEPELPRRSVELKQF